ncbi:hypothetical protein [Arachnia propionica]|uniref:hypothetical protein n=2 Tax=Arachnia propionica TaxID=1750 RepID=UPI000F6EA5A1|nr:hypothetical protein [Arachnia propionica]VEJ60027.1 Uncharacterised protein [Arachnia propionica]
MRKLVIWLTAAAVAIAGIVLAASATAKGEKATVGPSVVGIHAPCPATHPWPGDKAPISEITKQLSDNFGVTLAGNGWTDANRTQISVVWQALDAVSCTDFLANLKAKVSGTIGINAASIGGFAWGDWSLTKPGYLTFDFTKWKEAVDLGDIGRLSRIVIHEFTHIFNADRDSNPKYWTEFQGLAAKQEVFSSYAGRNNLETLPEVVGYYVARCAKDNPYDTGKFNAYYEWVKTNIFAGREFGPAPGTKASCNVTQDQIPTPTPDWVKALSGD